MRSRVALAAFVVGALVLAWIVRFGCDDAFISYVYSRNLIYGDGLTWFGDHVEGYTNFGWVLWNAIGLLIGLDPLLWSWLSSLAALAIVLLVTYRIAILRTGNATAALCAVALLTTNYTFLAYGTSGLETMAQCALLTVAYLLVENLRRSEEAPRPRALALLSLIASLALWTRLDSAVYLAVLGIVMARHLVRVRAPVVGWSAAVVPALVLVGTWLGWKLYYYGELLPNTFHAKVEVSSRTVLFGAKFIGWFILEYGLYLALATTAALAVLRRRFTARLPLALVIAWSSYILYAGGDFMEFRFIVPVMPALFIMLAEGTVSEGPPVRVKPWLRAAVITLFTMAMSLKHGLTWKGAMPSVDSIDGLRTFYGVVENHDWSQLGTSLGDVLQDTDAVIACNGAGAIPYYADIPTIDQLGLNDRWVARNGVQPPPEYVRPGHQRFATLDYLHSRNVNFVIGTPRLVLPGHITHAGVTPAIAEWIRGLLGPYELDIPEVTVVAAPISSTKSLLLWYRKPTQLINERMRAAHWEGRTFMRMTRPRSP